MTKNFHDKIKKSVKKAHPNYSDARAEQETNAVMATIAKRSPRKGTFPGRGRRPISRRRGAKK